MFKDHLARLRALLALAMMAAALGSSGCLLLAGGAAAGGAAGYAYYRGNVTESVEGDFTTVWHATHDALYDLGLDIKKVTQDNAAGVIESENGKGERVKICLDQEMPKIPTDPLRTTVGVRVATFGDQETSRRILQQIAFRANAQGIVNQPAAPAAQTSEASWRSPASPPP